MAPSRNIGGLDSPVFTFRFIGMTRHLLFIFILSLSRFPAVGGDADWPDFRGPTEQGLTPKGTQLPLSWSEAENITWKTVIKGKAWSSPVVWKDKIWLTNADEGGTRLSALCVDKNTGKVIHNKKLRTVAGPQYCHPFNSYASPSPVIDEDRVYLSFGAPWTGCLNAETGELIWERTDLECNHFRGPGSSPYVHGDLCYLHFDGSDLQYIIALNKKTGQTVWKTDRSVDFQDIDEKTGKPERDGDWRKAYSTPRMIKHNGRKELISLGSMALYSYDPLTGKELWRAESQPMHSGAIRPVIGHGLIYSPMGSRGDVIAVRPGGEGVVTDSHIAWRYQKVNPRRSSPILVGDLLFLVDDGGVGGCVDAKTGKEIWVGRIGGNFSASLIHADGKIWCFNEEGIGRVFEAGRKLKILSENQLDAGVMGSPAVSGNALFVRTKTHLYRIEEK